MATYDNNRSPNLAIPTEMISSFNNNTGIVKVGEDSFVLDCKDNRGVIRFLSNTEISNLSDNCGSIVIEYGGKIGTISHNMGSIKISPNSKIHCIQYNRGMITCGENCTVEEITDNRGFIRGLPNPNARNEPRGIRMRDLINQSTQPIRPHTVAACSNVSVEQNRRSGANRTVITIGGGNTYVNGILLDPNANFVPLPSTAGTYGSPRPSTAGSYRPPPPSTAGSYRPPPPSTVVEDQNDSENIDANKKYECIICMERPIRIAFGCGHSCCEGCAAPLQNCHMCRQRISNKIKLYL